MAVGDVITIVSKAIGWVLRMGQRIADVVLATVLSIEMKKSSI